MPGRTIDHCGAAALDALETLIAHRPEATHEKLTEVMRCLVRLRDSLIDERRREPHNTSNEERLRAVNSLLSLASSAEYPLVGVRWERICATRDVLRSLLDKQAVSAGG